MRSVTSGYRDIVSITTKDYIIFQKVTSPKVGMNHIVADSRQIIWREFLRSHCKHSTKAQMALPHNVAWPFFLFLPWYGCHVPAAMICGRKRPLTLNLASMLKEMVLPDNVAPELFPQIFLGLSRKSVAKESLGSLTLL